MLGNSKNWKAGVRKKAVALFCGPASVRGTNYTTATLASAAARATARTASRSLLAAASAAAAAVAPLTLLPECAFCGRALCASPPLASPPLGLGLPLRSWRGVPLPASCAHACAGAFTTPNRVTKNKTHTHTQRDEHAGKLR